MSKLCDDTGQREIANHGIGLESDSHGLDKLGGQPDILIIILRNLLLIIVKISKSLKFYMKWSGWKINH